MKEDRLYIQPLTGGRSELIQTAPMIYSWPDMNSPLFVFTENDAGKKVMSIGGTYYEKTIFSLALLKRIGWGIVILVIVVGAIAGLVSIWKVIRRQIRIAQWVPRLLPLVGLNLLVITFSQAATVQTYTYRLSEMGSINGLTLSIFLASLGFGLASMGYLGWAGWNFRKTENRKTAWFRLGVGIALCALMVLLWHNGWIGLRTWAM